MNVGERQYPFLGLFVFMLILGGGGPALDGGGNKGSAITVRDAAPGGQLWAPSLGFAIAEKGTKSLCDERSKT